jgi:hypothetical protein
MNDTDRPPAGVAAHRESHRQRRQHTHRDDQQKRDAVHPAVPRGGATATQHRHIDPERGQDQRHPKQGEQHDRETARRRRGS